MQDVIQKQKELGEKWTPADSVREQFEEINEPWKERITQALEEDDSYKEKGDLKFLLHQFNKANFLIEWYIKEDSEWH